MPDGSFEIIWVDRQLHEEAARRLARAGKRRVSFVDHVSFLVMKSRGIEKALAFDPDFSSEGFSDFRLRRSLCDRQPRDSKGPRGARPRF